MRNRGLITLICFHEKLTKCKSFANQQLVIGKQLLIYCLTHIFHFVILSLSLTL